MRHQVQIFTVIYFILFSNFLAEARIRLRKVKDAPKTCTIMKEEPFLSRPEKKILGTEKNSIIIDEQISLVGDLGEKQCLWPAETFSVIGDAKKINFYIDEYKNVLVAYGKNEIQNEKTGLVQNIVQQVQIDAVNCQLDQIKTLNQLSLPECHPPKKIKRKKQTNIKKSKNKPAKIQVKS